MKYTIPLLLLVIVTGNSCTHQPSLDSNAYLDVANDSNKQKDTLELTMDAHLSVCVGYGCFFDCDHITVQKGEFDQKTLSIFVYASPKLNTIDQRITPNRCSFVFVRSSKPADQDRRNEGFIDEKDGTYWKIADVQRVE